MNIYQTVTDRILQQLDAGQIPWRKSWTTGLPKSLTSGKAFRDVNILVLAAAGFTSRYRLTFRQARQLGGHVRKGETATPVVHWHWRTPEDAARLWGKTGQQDLTPCVPFTSAVFNLDQVEGVARPADDVPNPPHRRLEIADQVFEVMPDKPEILHSATQEPGYSPALDRITLPHLSQFQSADEYYTALFRELVHASGSRRRLNLFAETDRDRFNRYTFEGLVAEFGAAFLCAFAGLANPVSETLQAGYIQGWTQALRKDPRTARPGRLRRAARRRLRPRQGGR